MNDPPHDDEGETVTPLIPPRTANASQALFAIGLVFFLGLVIGFVLARTL
ncbi:MAG TPA: hypothetical protein VNB24_00230 [Acidimicrobiales bacterium]|nr:hypothetical protein [Acidimicrobiales bacterium]